jgi:hypothetical protein
MGVLVELISTVKESRLVAFELPKFLENASDEEKKAYAESFIKKEQVKYLADDPGVFSSVSFSFDIKDMNYRLGVGN